jgi:hypothetical protein
MPHHFKTKVRQGAAGGAETTQITCRTPPLYIRGGEVGQGSNQTPSRVGQSLTDLADRLSRLTPCHRDPHAYHDGKRSIVAELRRLARRME